MYIRRKVFSVAYDEATGEEKLFSTTEIMSEESYIEKLYSEAEEKKSGAGKKVAAGAGATAAVGAGGIYGAKKLGEKLADPVAKEKIIDAALKNKEITDEQFKKILAKQVKKEKLGENLQKPAKWIAKKIARK